MRLNFIGPVLILIVLLERPKVPVREDSNGAMGGFNESLDVLGFGPGSYVCGY